ncbi:hypothetical protein SK128_015805 [Halocaridina rubra]|uniref:Uncharacterized protein n=1 Tax=Halocaridina rubra TaxID=373956 RepID=A0AAN8X351_HALRR
MKFKSVIRESAESEIVSASLPGGRLMKASTLESQFWINFVDDPNGMVNWTSTIVSYSSSRASEWAFRSGVYHHSLSKPLKLGGHLVTEPTSANMQVLFDVFSGVDEALKVNVKLQNDRGSYIIISNLTRSMDTHPRVADAVISFLPSPDSGQISVVLIIPTQNEKEGQLLSQNSNHVDSDVHFILTCGLDAPVEYTAFSCRLTAPSVNEKVYVRYQVVKDSGCSGLSLSVGLLHQKYHMQQKSCRNPNSFQASLSTKTKKHQRQELAVRLGVLDTKQAELDIIDAAHVMFQLHPPFLLHVMGHSRGNLWSRWEDFKNGVHLEADELKNAGVSVVESFAEDVKMLKNLARISGPTPAHHLASYLTAQSKTLLEELSGDILIKEIAQSAQMCIDVTSVLLEACMAYMNHNYGKMFMEMGSSLTAWINERVKNIKHWFVTSAAVIQDAFVTTLNFIYRVPGMILDLGTYLSARWLIRLLGARTVLFNSVLSQECVYVLIHMQCVFCLALELFLV